MNNTKHRCLHGFLIAALSLGLAGAAQAERRGFYAGVEVGFAEPRDLDSRFSGINHPTRCDGLLDNHTPPANDPACTDNTSRTLGVNKFDLDTGFTGALNAGYMMGKWRFEAEYLHRTHEGESNPWRGAGGNVALGSKESEWSVVTPPSEEVRDFRSHQFFVNAYYDFLGDPKWTPYVGAGVGLADTSLRFRTEFKRRTIAEGYPSSRPAAAAGTTSFLDAEISDTLVGFQLLAGVDYALTEKTSVGVKARWAQFEELEESKTWNLIRNHEPVIADGVTPFRSRQEFDDVEYWALTVGIKHRF